MKKLMVIFLLVLVLPAMAAEIHVNPNAERYVADGIETVTLPSGEMVIRLVSGRGLTVRQYWTGSVYPRGSMVVFQGRRDATPNPGSVNNVENISSAAH
jgi:hypothetical protein